MRTELEERVNKVVSEMANVRVRRPILDTERLPLNEYSNDTIIHFYTYVDLEEKSYYVVFRNDKTYIGLIQKALIGNWDNVKEKFELLSECNNYAYGNPGIYGIYRADLHGITIHFYKTDEEKRREPLGWVFISWKALYCY